MVVIINFGGLGVLVIDKFERFGFEIVKLEEKMVEEFCFFFFLVFIEEFDRFDSRCGL